MEAADITELDKLEILLLNEMATEKPSNSTHSIEKQLAELINDFESQRASQKMTVFSYLNYYVPNQQLNSNVFSKYLSAIILREWKQQNANLYKNAEQKYNNYNLNESQFERFVFDNDSVYNRVWDNYQSINNYRTILKKQIQLALWPEAVQTDATLATLNFDANTIKYLGYFEEDESLQIPVDTVRKLLEKQITLYEKDLKIKIGVAISYAPNGDSRDVFLRRIQTQKKKEEKLVKNLRQGSSVLEKLLREFDPIMAKKAGGILDNSTDVYEAWSKWKHDYAVATADDDELKLLVTNVALGQGVISAAMSIHSILSKPNQPNADAIILKELRVLSAQIADLSKEMHSRFDTIDKNISIVYDNMNANFRYVFLDLANISYVTEQTRNDLLNAKKQLDNIEGDMLSYLQSSSQLQLQQNLTYYLDYKRNFHTDNDLVYDFKKGINEFAVWGISHPKSPLFAGGPNDYEMDNSKIPLMIRKFSKSDMYDANYFIQASSIKFNKVYIGPTGRTSNQNIWSLGSEAFLDFALDWKDVYKQHVTPNLINQLISNGQDLISSYRSILNDGAKVDTVLFDKLIDFNKQALQNLKSKFETQSRFKIANFLNKDANFSVWKINPLSTYKIKFPDKAENDTNIKHDYSSYGNDATSTAQKAALLPLGLNLTYTPRFGVDTSNILKYADILGLGSIKLKYNLWEYFTSNYQYRGIDIDPGSLTFSPSFTKLASGFMIAEARIGNYLIYKRAAYLQGVYLRSNPERPGLYLASARALADVGTSTTIPYSYLKRSYKELFEDIWQSPNGLAKERFFYAFKSSFPDSVNGIRGYKPYYALRALKCDVMNSLLEEQNVIYNHVLSQNADFDSEYKTLDGSLLLYQAYFNLGMPNVMQYDSLRSFFYSRDKLMNASDFKSILKEFTAINQQVLAIQARSGNTNTDALISEIKELYEKNAYVKPHFKLNITKYGNSFFVSWEEKIFTREIQKIDAYQLYAHKLFRRINQKLIIVHYPKIEPLLSKLYHLRNHLHN